MSIPFSIKITAIDRELGTFSVKFNDNDDTHWNLNMPLDLDGQPIVTRQELLDALVAQMYDVLEERELRRTSSFVDAEVYLDEVIDLTQTGEDYRIARNAARRLRATPGTDANPGRP